MTYHNALSALADPTRRSIFEQLRGGERAFAVIAASQRVSKPAVSQHLKALREAGLVAVRYEGKRGFFRANPEGLSALRDYLDSFWTDVLDNFVGYTKQEGERS
ncbi:MAG: metalloregulator ArsR/SmtB family transcription factor [Pseudomonadota bacterium]